MGQSEMTSRTAWLVLIMALPSTALAQTISSVAPQTSQNFTVGAEPQGRQTLRINRHFGAETEPYAAGAAFGRGLQRERDLQERGAAYGVAYLPVSPKADVFARAGYGRTDFAAGRAPQDGWSMGFGARYSPDANNGVRADFTRRDFRTSRIKANILSFGYARRF